MILTVVCDVLGEENNGTTIAAMNLIRSMREKGHTVRVVCPDEGRRGEKDYFVASPINFGIFNKYVAKNGVVLAKPDEALLREAMTGADAVHLITPFLLAMKAVKIAREMNIPLTAGFHCQAENFTTHLHLMNARALNKGVYQFFYRHVYRYIGCIHYPTAFIRGVFEEVVGPTPGRVISNGVNKRFEKVYREKPEEYKDRVVVLFTGRYSHEKRHSVLMKAARLSAHAGDIQLIFAGKGPLKRVLELYGKKLAHPPLLRFFSREEMLNILNYADLYVHPAEVEIEAIGCLEAIACGLVPVIADSPRSATRYFALDERNLFACNDPKDLAKKMDYWIEHPEEKALCSQSYRGYARRFDFDSCMNEMEDMILTNAGLRHE